MEPTPYRFFRQSPAGGELTPQPYEVFAYPMGDCTVRRSPELPDPGPAPQVLWVTTAAVDWTIVAAWAQLAAHDHPAQRRILVMPYLPSARGDKDIPGPARINGAMAGRSGITDLVTIDPHSQGWLQAMRDASGEIGAVVQTRLLPLGGVVYDALGRRDDLAGVIAPDRGARDRASTVAAEFDVPVFTAVKHRDPQTGKLSGYALSELAAPAGRYLVVDDICDGGGTFGLLAAAAPAEATLQLWVTHGGFTGGRRTRDALSRYAAVDTTDSLPAAKRAAPQDVAVTVHALRPWVEAAIRDLVHGDRAATANPIDS